MPEPFWQGGRSTLRLAPDDHRSEEGREDPKWSVQAAPADFSPCDPAGMPDRPRAPPQFVRFQVTERQISPPSTQPAVVSVGPESVIVPE